MTDPRFHDDPARKRYQLMVGDEEVGYIEYDPVGETSILIKHTEVLSGHEGQGLGSQLVRSALDHIRAQGKSVIPICPYALNYVRRHPEYRELVREDMRRTL
ncbi:MAG TPA: GNAT family N-acetyltransferase [Burkholderiaceae bacterium]|nr:GNAT family N-acetyltransferase [Burkholderiaceae bacterium]HQR71891.1 GNAT family N-acetyltransferase [Burkholderiaceae bacterium]